MFERVINQVISDGITGLTANGAGSPQPILRGLFAMPGWEDAEVDSLLAFWNGDGRPIVVHGYAREATKFPCYAIVLASEMEDPSSTYIGHDAGIYLKQAEELVAEAEAALGRVVEAKIRRFKVTYNVYVYTENPDVTLAYYNVLRTILLSGDNALEAACLEEAQYSGTDLVPVPNNLPTNLFTRQWIIAGWVHTLYFEDLSLGPLALGRGKSVARIHVNDNVTGVNPGLDPIDPAAES